MAGKNIFAIPALFLVWGFLKLKQLTSPSARKLLNLDQVRTSEEGIFRINERELGSQTRELINCLADTYRLFLGSLGGSNLEGHERDNHAIMACMVGCHYDKDMGLLAMLRGHKTDAAFYTRRAMEYASFGTHILQTILKAKDGDTPKKTADLYLNGIKGTTAFDKYRSEFPLMKLIGRSKEVFGDWFYDEYEELCKEAHATFESVSLKFQVTGEGNYHFSYYEIDAEKGIGKGLARLLQLVEIHMCIIRGFVNMLETAPVYDGSAVRTNLSRLEKLLLSEKQRWAKITKTAHENAQKGNL